MVRPRALVALASSALVLTLTAASTALVEDEGGKESIMTPSDHTWSGFSVESLRERRAVAGRPYLEFLRAASMSAGLYELAAGATDHQQPHDTDEIYYIVSGRARFEVGEEEFAVEPGSILYVAAGVEHRFHSITEDLSIIVVFSG